MNSDMSVSNAPSSIVNEGARVGRTEVPLTPAQRDRLEEQRRAGTIVGNAVSMAVALPLGIGFALFTLARYALRIPLIGWLLALYGIVLAVSGALLGVILAPFVFLVATPLLLTRRRSALADDLNRGVAIVTAGTFDVKDRKSGATLRHGDTRFTLSSKQMSLLRPRLQSGSGRQTFTGSISYVERAKLLLDVDSGAASALPSDG